MQQSTSSVSSGPSDEQTVGAHQLDRLRAIDAKIAKALDLNTCLKPEVTLMLELYQADREGNAMTVSVLGLVDGIPPTSTLRYLESLQKKGVIKRTAHETDSRMTYIEITDAAKRVIEAALSV